VLTTISPNSVSPSFIADVPGEYAAVLKVTDIERAEDTDVVFIAAI